MVRCPPSPPTFTGLRMSHSPRRRDSSPDSMDSHSDLLADLHALHADEFAYLSQRLTEFERKCERSWVFRSYAIVRHYVLFIFKTWVKAAWAFIFFPTTLMDRIAIVILSFAASAIMSIMLPWCLISNLPITKEIFDSVSRRLFNGLSIVNALYPSIFDELSREQIAAAKEHLSRSIEHSNNRPNKRFFNLDASKLLLQCAALMYERTTRTTHRAAAVVSRNTGGPRRQLTDWSLSESRPGAHITEMCGTTGARAVMDELHKHSAEENTIKDIARENLGLQYCTVSELNSTGSAFCGLFWDPHDTFIIVAFRGTSPTDFAEWSTDFTFQLRDAGVWLRGFGKAHDGFMNKVYPRRIPAGSNMPCLTIIEDIKRVAARLSEHSPDKKINVWITGHSLGCALASLVYSRLVCEPHECGINVVVRDAYLFAAPVVCDVESANAFNGRMNHYSDTIRTMWRVTNATDFVATGLPDGGDNPDIQLSPWNLFSFSHLGCEIKLREAPERCLVSGTHITPGTHVVIESAFHLDSLKDHRTPMRKMMRKMEETPIVGRLFAHCTGCYWSALQGVGAGTCEWVFD